MNLIGLFNPLETQACFGIPIFEENERYYTQVLADRDSIVDFEPCSVSTNRLTMLDAPRDASVGTAGVFCFFVSSSELIYGTKNDVRQGIASRVSEFQSRPFLAYEIADFLDDVKARDKANHMCAQTLLETALEVFPENLRRPNGESLTVRLIAQHSALSAEEILRRMSKRLSREAQRLREQWQQASGAQVISKTAEDEIYEEINLLRMQLLRALRKDPHIWDSCQQVIAILEPLDDIHKRLREWVWEEGLQALWHRIIENRSYATLLRYDHPLLAIKKLVDCLELREPDFEGIEQSIWNLLHGEGKPGSEVISGRLTPALRHTFSELAWLLEQLVLDNLWTMTSRRRVLRAAAQLVAGLPGDKRHLHFQVQDLAWRAVLFDKAGERSQAAALAAEALTLARSLGTGAAPYMWHMRLGDAHLIDAKFSGDLENAGWSQSDLHYQQALLASDLDGKALVYVRQAQARAHRLELYVGVPSEQAAIEMSLIALEGCEFAKMVSRQGERVGHLFVEARLRALLASSLRVALPELAVAAERELDALIEGILDLNPRHLGAIWLKFRFHVDKGDEYGAIQWLDEVVEALRETCEDANLITADFVEFRTARLMADLGRLGEAQQRFERMVTTTQPNSVEARREFLRLGGRSLQEDFAQQLYKRAYLEPVWSEERTTRANEALLQNQPLVDSDPSKLDVVPWTRHARLLLLLDECNNALEILNELRDKYPQDPYVLFHLGEAHYRQGVEYEENGLSSQADESYTYATMTFQQAWEIAPRVDTADRLAACWTRRKNVDQAKRILVEAGKLDPEDGQTNFSLGNLYYQCGELDQALRFWLGALRCFTQSEEHVDQRSVRLVKQAANAIVRFADDPTATKLQFDNLAPSALWVLTSAASSAGWNRSKIIECIGASLESLPQIARRRVPHALRAHLLYLQLADGNETAYQWHKRWYERLSQADDPKLFFEYATGAKGVFRRAAVWSVSALGKDKFHSLLATPTEVPDENRWGEFAHVASSWGIQENYYSDAYAEWPRGIVTCDELWGLMCWLNAKLLRAAFAEVETGLTPNSTDAFIDTTRNLPLEFEMLPANALDPRAPASMLVQTDELFSQILMTESRHLVERYAVSPIRNEWAAEGSSFRTSIYDGATVPINEVNSLRISALRGEIEVTCNENRGINLAWPTSVMSTNIQHFA